MAQRKFLKPIVGGAIGLGILGIAGAVFAAGETAVITASGTGSGTSTTAVVYADSTLTCLASGSGGSTTVTALDWYDDSAKTTLLEAGATGSAATLSDVFGTTFVKGDTIYCHPTFANSAVASDFVTVVNKAPDAGTPEVSAIGGINDSITCADGTTSPATDIDTADLQIGRASCRERV